MDQICVAAQADNYVRAHKAAKARRDTEIAAGIPQNPEQQLEPLVRKFQEQFAKTADWPAIRTHSPAAPHRGPGVR